MKVVIVSLFVFVMIFSFVVAESSSSTQTNFYIRGDGMNEGYEDDIVTDSDFSQSELLSKVIYWSAIIIALAVFIRFLKGTKSRKTSVKISKKKIKRVRRKKK